MVHFPSPAGLAAYLPALLTVALRDHDQLDLLPRFLASSLTRHTDSSVEEQRFDEILRHLTAAQRRAVALALRELEALSGEHRRAAPATAALDSYWRKKFPAR
jgi:hypothetical protein